jgi:addiction module HigA family antidote
MSAKMTKKLQPVHPGEILTEDFLNPMHLTPYAVAARTGVPRTRIERLAQQKTAMTADTALRLGRLFGVSAAFWMNIQARYDLERAEDEAASSLASITPYRAA